MTKFCASLKSRMNLAPINFVVSMAIINFRSEREEFKKKKKSKGENPRVLSLCINPCVTPFAIMCIPVSVYFCSYKASPQANLICRYNEENLNVLPPMVFVIYVIVVIKFTN